MAIRELKSTDCRLSIEASSLNMSTTEDVSPLSGIAAQQRALKALEFGLDIRQPRFHVVAVGDPGSGRTFSARSLAKRVAAGRPTPDDVLLLPNPVKPSQPTVISLPPGEGPPFVEAMEELHENLVDGLRRVPEGERFKHARARIERRAQEAEGELESALYEVGEELGLELTRTEDEVKVADADGGEPSAEALRAITAAVEEFEEELLEVQDGVDTDLRSELKRLMLEAVRHCFSPFKDRFADSEPIKRVSRWCGDAGDS